MTAKLLVDASYFVVAVLFILGLKAMSVAGDGAQGHRLGRDRHGGGNAGHLLHTGHAATSAS
jgi:NAD/NADP transhydrogenase beta subunit